MDRPSHFGTFWLTTIVCIFLSLSACDEVPSISESRDHKLVKQGLERAYNKPLCFKLSLGYPFQVPEARFNRTKLNRANILADNDILTRSMEREYKPGIGYVKIYTFNLTKKGAAMLNENFDICYGETKVTEILDIKKSDERKDGFIVTFVKEDVTPYEWASSEEFEGLTALSTPKTLRRSVVKSKAGEQYYVPGHIGD